jgi:hypothetical protein
MEASKNGKLIILSVVKKISMPDGPIIMKMSKHIGIGHPSNRKRRRVYGNTPLVKK